MGILFYIQNKNTTFLFSIQNTYLIFEYLFNIYLHIIQIPL